LEAYPLLRKRAMVDDYRGLGSYRKLDQRMNLSDTHYLQKGVADN